jgi:glycosyltransferase involved in cell wall biosynthesis
MVKKNKILFVGPLPPPYAGPEISAKMFTECGINDHFIVEILNTNFRKSNSEKGKIDLQIFIAFFKLTWNLAQKLIKHRPKIVYYYVTSTILGWLAKDVWVILISKILGAKVVIHMRAGHFRKNYDASNFFVKAIIKFFLNLTNFNLAQSESLTLQYKGIVKDESKIGFVYNMIDIEKFNGFDSQSVDKNVIFFMGHLSNAKGYTDILKVMPAIISEFPAITFCFAGTLIKDERNVFINAVTNERIEFSDPEEIFNTYIKGKYESNYNYVGKLDEKQKLEWLKVTSIFILPSYSEGFSMSVLEAIAAGKPIVTCPVGALKDVIKDRENGILITPGDTDKLKDSILELLRNNALRESISKNNFELRKSFSIQEIEKQYIKLFKNLI